MLALEHLLPILSAAMGVTTALWSARATTRQVRQPRRTIQVGGETYVFRDVEQTDLSVQVEDGPTVTITQHSSSPAGLKVDQWDWLVEAAEEAVQRPADDDLDLLPDETGHLSTEEERLVARHSADTVNLTLARLFVRLGPPPLNANGEGLAPVSSGDGGSAR
ncbi:hypothetical protein [Streptomyces murinus]|uniref:hypothetical protein n=1 Tax=Streptomyces murinus TaxID=33900 RepID=UPI0037FA1B03